MERNTAVCADALDWLRSLEAGSVDVFWSSPPYNLDQPLRAGMKGGRGPRHRYAGGAGTSSGVGDGLQLPERDYQRAQAAVLSEWHRVLADDGLAFYNHKVRIQDGRAISPLEWVFRTPFVLLQEVVWDRRGTANVDTCRFLPVSERIYVLGKRAGVRLHNPDRMPDVLSVPPVLYTRSATGHPCPTHPVIVRACLSVVPRPPDGRRLVVADPYAGTGTTGQVAAALGMDYLLCDHVPAYVAQMERNLRAPWQAQLALHAS